MVNLEIKLYDLTVQEAKDIKRMCYELLDHKRISGYVKLIKERR